MKKTILEIYGLAVCFVLVICFLITSIFAVYDIFKINYPELTLSSWQYQKLYSNENYCANSAKVCEKKNEASITKTREHDYQNALLHERREGKVNLIFLLIILSLSALLFIPHWWLASRARRAYS